jgi:hypothetical protein
MLCGGIVVWNSTFNVGVTLLGFGVALWCVLVIYFIICVYFATTISNNLFMNCLRINVAFLTYPMIIIYLYIHMHLSLSTVLHVLHTSNPMVDIIGNHNLVQVLMSLWYASLILDYVGYVALKKKFTHGFL